MSRFRKGKVIKGISNSYKVNITIYSDLVIKIARIHFLILWQKTWQMGQGQHRWADNTKINFG